MVAVNSKRLIGVDMTSQSSANPTSPQTPPGQIVTIEVDETTLHLYDHRDHLIKQVFHTSRKDITRQSVRSHHRPPNRLA